MSACDQPQNLRVKIAGMGILTDLYGDRFNMDRKEQK